MKNSYFLLAVVSAGDYKYKFRHQNMCFVCLIWYNVLIFMCEFVAEKTIFDNLRCNVSRFKQVEISDSFTFRK